MTLRQDCEQIVRQAIAAVQPDEAVRRALEEDPAQVALEMQLDVERLQPAGPAGR